MEYSFKELKKDDFTLLSETDFSNKCAQLENDFSYYFGSLADINNLRYEEFTNDLSERTHEALLTDGINYVLFVD